MNQMDGKNQYRCHFCMKMCKPLQEKCPEFSKHARWHYCRNCDTHFAVGPKCTLQGVQFGVADPKTEKNIYHMLINFKRNKTRIDYMDWTDELDITLTGTGLVLVPGTTYTITSRNGGSWTYTVPPKWRHKVKPIITLDKAVKGVTPKNALDKIKMYILFS